MIIEIAQKSQGKAFLEKSFLVKDIGAEIARCAGRLADCFFACDS